MTNRVFYQNSLFDCGEACLKTILLHYGCKVNFLRNEKNQGMSAYEIIKISKQMGLKAKGVEGNISHLNNNLLPCIAHVLIDKTYYHYLVILKNNIKTKTLTIHDPSYGIKKLTYEEFNKITTNAFIIFSKNKITKIKDNRFKNLLWETFKHNKKMIIKIIIFVFIFSFLSIGFSYYFKFLFNYQNDLLSITTIFIIICLLKTIINYYKNIFLIKLNQNIDNDFNKHLLEHLFYLPYNYCQKSLSSDFITLTNDSEILKNIIVKIFIALTIDCIFIILLALIMLKYSFIFFILFIIFFTICLLFAVKYQEQFNEKFLKYKNIKLKYSGYLINYLTKITTIKNNLLEENIITNINEKHKSLLKEQYCYHQNTLKYDTLLSFVEEIFYVLVILISMILINKQIITTLELLVFINIYNLFITFTKDICETIVMYKTYNVSIIRILDILDIDKEQRTNLLTEEIKKIAFNNITYNNDNLKLFNRLNLTINKRDLIFLSGENGVGKTTLMKMIFNDIDNIKGNIFINNQNIIKFNSYSLRNKITYLNNEYLFNDTIYNNLKIVNSNDNKIQKVLDICEINEFLKKKNIDVNYIISEQNNNLSSGELAKIKIARALLRENKIIIFDESFKEIDETEERKILKNIISNYDITIIFISHRKSNIDLFNRVLTLKKGKIYEGGMV